MSERPVSKEERSAVEQSIATNAYQHLRSIGARGVVMIVIGPQDDAADLCCATESMDVAERLPVIIMSVLKSMVSGQPDVRVAPLPTEKH